MSARFLIAFLSVLLVTAVALGGAGYAVTRIVVPKPRDLFRASAFEFELAPGWWCEREEDEPAYTCSPPGKPPYAAVVVMAMKERSDEDNLESYENHLRKGKPVGTSNNATEVSRVRYIKRRKIGEHDWVEALHEGSELQKYNTYYLATNTSFLGILVTMSVEENELDKYVSQLNEMMRTLHIYQR